MSIFFRFIKIIFLIGISFYIFGHLGLYAQESAPEKPLIIPRINWEANELFTSLDSIYWQDILEKRRIDAEKNKGKIQAQRELKEVEDYKKSLAYINENFSKENTIVETQRYDLQDGFRLAWPHKYTETVDVIIVHHTTGNYPDDITALKSIYKYHSLNRGWGDIGYHYIIGKNGTIYEGKKGGDYVAGAHSKWNNFSTLGIAVIGDYSTQKINPDQYIALKKLIRYLTWRYGIDTTKKRYYHRDCDGKKCEVFPLETMLDVSLVGHRDTGHTSCPGDFLYGQLEVMRRDIDEYSRGFIPVKRGETPKGERQFPESKKILKLEGKIYAILRMYSKEELELLDQGIENLDTLGLTKESQELLQITRKIVKILLSVGEI